MRSPFAGGKLACKPCTEALCMPLDRMFRDAPFVRPHPVHRTVRPRLLSAGVGVGVGGPGVYWYIFAAIGVVRDLKHV